MPEALATVDQAPPAVEKKPARLDACGTQVRVYPTDEQAHALRRWVGSGRFVWNWALEQQHAAYRDTHKHVSANTLSRQLTTLLQSGVESHTFLKQVPRTGITRTLKRLDVAWKGYFDGLKGLRADKPGQPNFRCRGGSRETLQFQVDPRHRSPVINDGNPAKQGLRIPGLGVVPTVYSQRVSGRVTAITIQQKGDAWWASLQLVEIPARDRIRKRHRVRQFVDPMDPTGLCALDLVVKDAAGAVATSNGVSAYSLASSEFNTRMRIKQERKQRYQRSCSRKLRHRALEAGVPKGKKIPKGTKLTKSRRQEQLDRKVAGITLGMLFDRRDHIHKFTTDLVRNHHTIVVETLMIYAMAQSLSRGFRRKLHDACMGEIIRQLKYKCARYGRTLIFVDRWFPSSKRCSNPACHQRNTDLKLKDRPWTCRHCGVLHDRDANAAFNLWQEGWRLLQEQSQGQHCQTVGSTGIASGAEARSQDSGQRSLPDLQAVKLETTGRGLPGLACRTPQPGMDPGSGVVE